MTSKVGGIPPLRRPGARARRLALLAVFVSLSAALGCARRLRLTPDEFERVAEREQATDRLRVYVSKKLVVHHTLADDAATYSVDRSIETSSEENVRRFVVGRRTRGLVVDSENQNGAPLLWVTFDPDCGDRSCAFGFVQTEDGAFRLHHAPDREGYHAPAVFYAGDRRPMALGKLASLAEKNEVYVWKNRRAKVFTLDLIVEKRAATKHRVETERGTGIE